MKERIRDLASRGVVASGLSTLGREFRRQEGTLILYGHRVADDEEGYLQGLKPQWLDDQLSYLTRHYDIIPLRTLVQCLEEQRSPPQRSVVLTFDDGFRDNLETAFPVLAHYHVPATIFVVTRSLSNGELPWSERLGVILQHTAKTELAHPLFGSEIIALHLPSQRRNAYQRIKHAIAGYDRPERDRVIDTLAECLDVTPPRDRMLDWEQARYLMSQGIEIGGHGYSHALLGKVSAEAARREIERCKADMEEHLGLDSPFFCLPGGSYTETTHDLIRQTGFRSCFRSSPRKRINCPSNATPFSLSRVGLPNAPSYHLEAELDGVFHPLRQCYHRVKSKARPHRVESC